MVASLAEGDVVREFTSTMRAGESTDRTHGVGPCAEDTELLTRKNGDP